MRGVLDLRGGLVGSVLLKPHDVVIMRVRKLLERIESLND
jgi:hypothetical protein